MNNGIAVVGAGIVFGAGIAVGAAFFHQDPVRQAPASSRAAIAAAEEEKPVPAASSDPSILAEIRRELAGLAAAVAELRRERSAAPAGAPSAAGQDGWKSVVSGDGTVAISRGASDPGERRQKARRQKLAKAGLQEPQQEGVESQFAAERQAVEDRFRAEVEASAWEEYRALKAKGWHRMTGPDHEKIQAMDTRFRSIQEQVLRQWSDATAYRVLTAKQRDLVESMRGGHLDVGPDGNPAVRDMGEGETTFIYSVGGE